MSDDLENQKRISNRLVDLIDILFGVVVGLNFALIFNNNPIVSLPTFSDVFTLPNISLLVAYIAVILSWVGYHQMMEYNSFILNRWGYIRFSNDVLIVFAYSLLIYSIKNFTLFLTIFPVIFLLYAFGGVVRNKEYKCKVSWPKGSVAFATAGFIVLLFWIVIEPATSQYSFLGINPLALALLVVTLAYNLYYRYLRAKKGFNTKNRPKKAMVLKIAVDIDGVLADQVTPVLKRLNARFNLSLTNKDIMEWDQKIGNTNIKVEIENALLEKEHVLSLSVIQGAIEGMKYLYDNYYVTIATSRPKETEEYTKKWVSSHFKYHVFCNTRGRSKDCVQSDVLIDDHIPNIVDFVKENGFGLLFSQPWNQKRSMIDGIMREGRIFYCEDWKDVVNTVKKLNSAIDKVPT